MSFTFAEKLAFCWLIGLLSQALLTECDKIRLVGPSRCSGRVEVYHEGSWGTVCDDNWSLSSAEVACRELSCGTVLEAKSGAFFGQGKDQIWLDDVECTGSESSILSCQHRPFGVNNCGHSEDAGVVCSDPVRLINGTDRCSGTLEVFHNGEWDVVCNKNWDLNKANTVCGELNCGALKNTYSTSGAYKGYTSTCPGNMTSVLQCFFTKDGDMCQAVSIVCAGIEDIKLVNGSDRCSGRVEVFFNGRWGTVCDDDWDIRDAQVVCRAMDCGPAQEVKKSAFFGQGEGEIWLDDVGCYGNESALEHCQHPSIGEHNCGHGEDAGVVCTGVEDIKLVNGSDRCSGRVEVFFNGRWGTVCDDFWDIRDAQVVCRAMDCGPAQEVKKSAFFGQGEGEIWLDDVECYGNESALEHCQHRSIGEHNCGHKEDAGVVCAAQIRVVGGRNACSGRVEVMHKGEWGSVCDDDWDMNDAKVVCRQLGCGLPVSAVSRSHFGIGTGPIWMDNVACRGTESALTQCRHNGFGEHNCGRDEDAGVICLD